MTHVLVTGASGLVGSHVVRALLDQGHDVAGTYGAHPERLPRDRDGMEEVPVDLADERSVEAAFRKVWPEAVVHCAALSELAACEADADRARLLNVDSSAKLARLCYALGSRFILLSTDQVFDGEAGGYTEEDRPAPIHAYGRSKRDAEVEVTRIHPTATIVRLSLVYGRSPSGDRSTSEKLVAALQGGPRPRLFTDEFRSPILVDDVARVIAEILAERDLPRLNLAGPERLSRYDLGVRVAVAFGLDRERIDAVSMDAVELSLRRPKDLSLDTRKLRATVRRPPRPLAEALEMLAGGPDGP